MSNEEKVLVAGTAVRADMKQTIETIASLARGGRESPPADPFDQTKYAFGVKAGANKFGWTTCPTCGKPPTDTGANGWGQVFQFRDLLSAREYAISGMCQACQDGVFGNGEGEDE